MRPRRVAILGSTGSIGRQALQVISDQADRLDKQGGLQVCALAAGSNWELLAEQVRKFKPPIIALADEQAAANLRRQLPDLVEVLSGPEAATELVRRSRPDVLLTAVVGTAGLAPTLAGIDCGATLAIANKETLVMAGEIVISAARSAGLKVLPVDSEHSAIFQCLSAGQHGEVRRVVITASGGALRDWHPERLANATVADTLNHPTWQMGQKVTIDSATLINKAMEVVEAHWLFDLSAEQIEVVIHPESIVHSFVEFCDGSIIAQLGPPDMTTPIAYALNYPHRRPRNVEPLDLARLGQLTFKPSEGRFARAVSLGSEAVRRGGVAGAVLNSANEAAVESFLSGKLSFEQIVPVAEEVLNNTPNVAEVTLGELLRAEQWARQQVAEKVAAKAPEDPVPAARTQVRED